MDTEVSYNFDDIRPLNNNEVKDAIEALVTNEDFERAFRYIKPDVNWKEFSETMRSFKTKEDFKSKLAYEAVMLVANKTTFSLTISGRSRLPKDKKPGKAADAGANNFVHIVFSKKIIARVVLKALVGQHHADILFNLKELRLKLGDVGLRRGSWRAPRRNWRR